MKKYHQDQFKGFKLISLYINNKVLGENRYEFIDTNNEIKDLYTTILIGPNGAGKSNVLSTIIYLFKELNHLKLGEKRTYDVSGEFNLTYSLNGDIFEFTNLPEPWDSDAAHFSRFIKQASLLRNGEIVDPSQAEFPLSIVAQAIMLTDKYPVITKDEEAEKFGFYNYLGVRSRPQQASTRYYVRKTIEFVVERMKDQSFKHGLKKITNYLELSEIVKIRYRTLNTSKFFWGETSKVSITDFFIDIKNRYDSKDTNPPYKLQHFLSIRDDQKLIDKIAEYCNELFSSERLQNIPNSPSKYLYFNLIEDSDHSRLKEEYPLLEHLRSLGIISTPEIELYSSKSSGYDLQESSSGEYHFFSTMVGLIASIKTNSLVLIDEPEISLHPNWQMKYLSFLREILSNEEYSTCHILIATHSHFLISDLRGDSGRIIGLRRDEENKIKTVQIETNTFGWSAEEVLLDVFKVPTTRNRFISDKLGEILDEISKPNKNLEKIQAKVAELIDSNIHNLSEEDPLKEVIGKIIEKYG